MLLPDVGEIEVVKNGFSLYVPWVVYAPPKGYGIAELFGMYIIECF
jgi:hypothetical protein